jgi:hypothetical protein
MQVIRVNAAFRAPNAEEHLAEIEFVNRLNPVKAQVKRFVGQLIGPFV